MQILHELETRQIKLRLRNVNKANELIKRYKNLNHKRELVKSLKK